MKNNYFWEMYIYSFKIKMFWSLKQASPTTTALLYDRDDLFFVLQALNTHSCILYSP